MSELLLLPFFDEKDLYVFYTVSFVVFNLRRNQNAFGSRAPPTPGKGSAHTREGKGILNLLPLRTTAYIGYATELRVINSDIQRS